MSISAGDYFPIVYNVGMDNADDMITLAEAGRLLGYRHPRMGMQQLINRGRIEATRRANPVGPDYQVVRRSDVERLKGELRQGGRRGRPLGYRVKKNPPAEG